MTALSPGSYEPCQPDDLRLMLTDLRQNLEELPVSFRLAKASESDARIIAQGTEEYCLLVAELIEWIDHPEFNLIARNSHELTEGFAALFEAAEERRETISDLVSGMDLGLNIQPATVVRVSFASPSGLKEATRRAEREMWEAAAANDPIGILPVLKAIWEFSDKLKGCFDHKACAALGKAPEEVDRQFRLGGAMDLFRSGARIPRA